MWQSWKSLNVKADGTYVYIDCITVYLTAKILLPWDPRIGEMVQRNIQTLGESMKLRMQMQFKLQSAILGPKHNYLDYWWKEETPKGLYDNGQKWLKYVLRRSVNVNLASCDAAYIGIL